MQREPGMPVAAKPSEPVVALCAGGWWGRGWRGTAESTARMRSHIHVHTPGTVRSFNQRPERQAGLAPAPAMASVAYSTAPPRPNRASCLSSVPAQGQRVHHLSTFFTSRFSSV